VFQKLEGEVTREGLWLTSTAEPSQGEHFRVVATGVGRVENVAQPSRLHVNRAWPPHSTSGDETPAELAGEEACATSELPLTGTVAVAGKVARFIRPGFIEEYFVSMDGVRQDFIIERRPEGEGELRVELTVTGAKAEPLVHVARLVLDGSGRKIAYSRLRVTDATARELSARLEVDSVGDEVTARVRSDAGRAGSPSARRRRRARSDAPYRIGTRRGSE
jgi:hypothetical protein